MGFLRVVEVFPPHFPADPRVNAKLDLEGAVGGFIDDAKRIRRFADLFLVANMKNPALVKMSSVEAASMLERSAGVKAAPVVVARDGNRNQVMSALVTGLALGLSSMMVAWGDRYPPSAGVRNAYDFPSLARVIAEARSLSLRAGREVRILAPADLSQLARGRDGGVARKRLDAGADILLAQPPTTDSTETFERHSRVLKRAGLSDLVLLGIFPFRDRADVEDRARDFGWDLPEGLLRAAAKGSDALVQECRLTVGRLRDEGYPGVYLSTRGDPEAAEKILG